MSTKIHKIELRVDAKTGEVKQLRNEISEFEKDIIKANAEIRKLQSIKRSASKGILAEDLEISKELKEKLGVLVSEYQAVKFARDKANASERKALTTDLQAKKLKIEKLLNSEINNHRHNIDKLNHSQKEANRTLSETNGKLKDERRNRANLISALRSEKAQRKGVNAILKETLRLEGKIATFGGFINSIRQIRTLAVAVYSVKSAWDNTLGAGLEYAVEMEQIDIKLKGILASSAEMTTSTGRVLDTVNEKWKIAGDMAKHLRTELKKVAIETGSNTRDTGRILSAIMPQALKAGATMGELSELTKGFMVTLKTGALTVKEAVNSLDNVVSGDAKNSELVNYLKTLGISMKELKGSKGHEAIEILITKLKQLHPILKDYKKSYEGLKATLSAQWLSTMGKAVEPFKQDLQLLMAYTTSKLQENEAEIVAGSRFMLAKLSGLYNMFTSDTGGYFKDLKDILVDGVGIAQETIGVIVDMGKGLRDLVSDLMPTVNNFTKLYLGVDLAGVSLKKVAGVLVALKVMGVVKDMTLGLVRAFLRLSGLGVIFPMLYKGTKLLGIGVLRLTKLVGVTLPLAFLKGFAKGAMAISFVGTAVTMLRGKFKGLIKWLVPWVTSKAKMFGKGGILGMLIYGAFESMPKVKSAGGILGNISDDLKKETDTLHKAVKKELPKFTISKTIGSIWDGMKGKFDDLTKMVKDSAGENENYISKLFGADKLVEGYQAELKKVQAEIKKTDAMSKKQLDEVLTYKPQKPTKDEHDDVKKKAQNNARKHLRELRKFDAEYAKVTKGDLAKELVLLKQLKEDFIAEGRDKVKVEEWYQSAVHKVRLKYIEKANRLHQQELKKQKALNAKELREKVEFTKALKLARGHGSSEDVDMYNLDVQREKYLRTKQDALAVDEWYNLKKAEITEKYEDKAQDVMKEYYKASNMKLEVFSINASRTIRDLIKNGMSPENASVVYDKLHDDFLNGVGKQFKTLGDNWKSLVKDMGKELSSGLSSAFNSFAKTGKFNLRDMGESMYDSATNYLKMQNDPISKGLGYGADILRGLLSKEGTNPLNEYDVSSQSITNGLDKLAKIAKPQYKSTKLMVSYLKNIEHNTLMMAKNLVSEFNGLPSGSSSGSTWKDVVGGLSLGGIVGGILSLGNSKSTETTNYGISLQAQSLADALVNPLAMKFKTDKTTKKYAFGAWKSTNYNRTDSYDPTIGTYHSKNISEILDSVKAMGTAFGTNVGNVGSRYAYTKGDIDIAGLSEADVQKKISDWYSTILDTVVKGEFGWLEEYRKADETIADTGMRAMGNFDTAKSLLKELGVNVEHNNLSSLSVDDIVKRSIIEAETSYKKSITRAGFFKHSAFDGLFADMKKSNTIMTSIGKYLDKLTLTADEMVEVYKNLLDVNSNLNMLNLGGFDAKMVAGAGGSEENLAKGVQAYISKFYTDDDQKKFSIDNANKDLAKYGLDLPETTQAYRDLAESMRYTDPKAFGYLMDNASRYYELMEDNIRVGKKELDIKKELLEYDKKQLTYTRDILKTQVDSYRTAQSSALGSMDGLQKELYSRDIFRADAKFGTRNDLINSTSAYSSNLDSSFGFDALMEKNFLTTSLVTMGGVVQTEVKDTTQHGLTQNLLDKVAQMSSEIERLNDELSRGTDVFGNQQVVIVGDER